MNSLSLKTVILLSPLLDPDELFRTDLSLTATEHVILNTLLQFVNIWGWKLQVSFDLSHES